LALEALYSWRLQQAKPSLQLFNILDYSAQLAQRPVALLDCLYTLGNRGVRRTRVAVICKGKLSSAVEFAVG
jgi:hypothetical protein